MDADTLRRKAQHGEPVADYLEAALDIYTVDVAHSTHDLLVEGVTEHGWHRVTVAANSAAQAEVIAAQMVAATTGMPTRTRIAGRD